MPKGISAEFEKALLESHNDCNESGVRGVGVSLQSADSQASEETLTL